MICLHCKRDDVRVDDPWVPVAHLGKQKGWAHQSCERAWREQQRAHDAAIASAERKRARDIAIAAVERRSRIKRFALYVFVVLAAVLLLERYWL